MHLPTQQNLKSRLPRPEDRAKLEQMKSQLASKETALQDEITNLDGINAKIAQLQEEYVAHPKIVVKWKRRVDQSTKEVAEQLKLIL